MARIEIGKHLAADTRVCSGRLIFKGTRILVSDALELTEAGYTPEAIARQYRGAFLCDGVGLGKTFVGLLLIERLIMKERKRVALFVPKAARKPVWESALKKYLSKHMEESDIPEINALMVFTSDQVEIDTEDSAIPAMKLKQIKEFMRQKAKAKKIPVETINKITAVFG